jgi:Ca2+-binding EF-hand superfamily protein
MSTLTVLARGSFAALIIVTGLGTQAQTQTPKMPQAPSATTTPAPSPAEKATLDAAFKRADTNGDGKLSPAELAQIPALASRFADLDKDKDGSISAAEFSTGVQVKGD